MENNALPYWLQVGANIGLLLGLVFVGLQFYQDRQLKTAELIAGSLQQHHDRNISLMGDDPASTLSKLDSHEELDDRDEFIAQAYFDARFANWSRNSILENLGLLSASWSSGVVLADHLWANQYGIKAVERYLRDSPSLTTHIRTRLTVELQRVRIAYSDKKSRASAK
ncbi:MAG: hypothetical protein ACI9WC_001324 [Arenicella sp.]|jgi:hypothetical protein